MSRRPAAPAALLAGLVGTLAAAGVATAEPPARPLAERLAVPYVDPVEPGAVPAATPYKPEEHADVLALVQDSPHRNGVLKAFAQAFGNGPVLAQALLHAPAEDRSDLLRLLAALGHLDLVSADADNLLEDVAWARRARREAGLAWVDDDLFHAAVLSQRFTPFDFLERWRRPLYDRCAEMRVFTGEGATRSLDVLATARRVNEWVAANCVLRDVQAYFAAPPSPAAVVAGRAGNETDLAVATAGILRALGVPARVHPNLRWAEVRDRERWVPVYPRDPARLGAAPADAAGRVEVGPTGTILLRLTRHGLPLKNDEAIAISRWARGAWEALDERSGILQVRDAGDALEATLPPGTWLVTAGVRSGGGDAYVFARVVNLRAGATVVVAASLDYPLAAVAPEDRLVRPLAQVPDLTGTDRAGVAHALRALAAGTRVCLIFFSDAEEPSRRMVPLLDGVRAGAAGAGVTFLGIDLTPAGAAARPGATPPGFPCIADPEGRVARAFGLAVDKDGHAANLPSVLLLARGGRAVFWQEGYDLNVAAALLEAIELSGKD